MKRFQDLPIQRKVTTVVLAVFASALLLSAVGVFLHQSATFRRWAEAELTASANLLALAMDSPVAWGDRTEGAMILARLRRNSEISGAYVYELPERTRVFVQDPTNAPLPRFLFPLREGAYFDQGQLWLVKDLRRGGTGPYATLVLHSRLTSLHQERLRSFGVLGLVMLTMLLPSFMVASYLARSLIGPLASLANTVHQITEHRGERLRASRISRDEIGLLAADFNRMLDALEKRETDLAESERNYREIFDGSSDPVFIHDMASGTILDANRAACNRYGYSREELIGGSVALLSQGDPPWSESDAFVWMQKAFQEGPQMVEWLAKSKGGETFWAEVSLRGIQIGGQGRVMAVVRDITERKRAQEALQESERRFRSLVEEADSLPVQGYDRNGVVFFWNRASEKLLGYSREEAMGRRIEEMLESVPLQQMLDGWVSHGEPIPPAEMALRHKDGASVPVYCSYVPLLNRHGQVELYCVNVDLSERRRAAAEKEKLEFQFHQAQKMEAIGKLAGGVAHDFNNLLQVINGFTNLAMEALPERSPAATELSEVLRAGDRARQLVSQLLTFSRRQLTRPETLDLGLVAEEFLRLLKRVLGEHIRMEFIPAQSPCVVRADRGQLEQVLMNLCVNARDAMPDGGTLTLGVEEAVLDESFCRTHGWATPGHFARLSVADTGCGMDFETQQHVFEPFFTTKLPGKGTGLGLATVYGIVHQHNGFIHLYSEVGKGTVFRIYLPLAQQRVATSPLPQEGLVRGGTETILLAEDEEMVRRLAQRILQGAGYTVLAASDGQEALQVFEQNQSKINLALLDVVMPRMGGWAVSKALRQIHPALPVIFASGYNPDQAQPSLATSEDAILLEKPFSPAKLLRKVREVLDRATP